MYVGARDLRGAIYEGIIRVPRLWGFMWILGGVHIGLPDAWVFMNV